MLKTAMITRGNILEEYSSKLHLVRNDILIIQSKIQPSKFMTVRKSIKADIFQASP